MKIIMADFLGNQDCDNPVSWHFIPDSALANAGKPFFIPDFADSFEATLSPVVRVSRIGKSIAEKFASRYYTDIAPAVHFRAPALMHNLLSSGLPADRAYCFDRAIIIGDFIPVEKLKGNGVFSLTNNGSTVCSVNMEVFLRNAEKALSAASSYNTMKMGDLVAAPSPTPSPITIGDRLEVTVGDSLLLSIAIK